jgi:hypothetical protein
MGVRGSVCGGGGTAPLWFKVGVISVCVERVTTCPHCGNTELTVVDGDVLCLDCYWQPGDDEDDEDAPQ